MGGPCFLVEKKPDTGKPGPKLKKTEGPACTDNFQIAKFEYEGKEWHSVEQAYQGYKFEDEAAREKIRSALPNEGESSYDYGQRMWRIGQQGDSKTAVDGVELMYNLCSAKLAQYPKMQEELLATGTVTIHGGPSTGQWSKWNGLIQTRLREELHSGTVPGSAGLKGDDLLEALLAAEPQLIELGLIKPDRAAETLEKKTEGGGAFDEAPYKAAWEAAGSDVSKVSEMLGLTSEPKDYDDFIAMCKSGKFE